MCDHLLTPRVWALKCLVDRYGSIEKAFIASHAEQGMPEGIAGATYDYRVLYQERAHIPSYVEAHFLHLYPWNRHAEDVAAEVQPPRVFLLAAE